MAKQSDAFLTHQRAAHVVCGHMVEEQKSKTDIYNLILVEKIITEPFNNANWTHMYTVPLIYNLFKLKIQSIC